MVQTIALVACSKRKANYKTPAEELYQGKLFIKSSPYAKQHADTWYILSGMYGLLEPSKTIEPYNRTLNTMSVKERKHWAKLVLKELLPLIEKEDTILFLAGIRYREYLISGLIAHGCKISIPMEGLGIGQQLQWLNKQNSGSIVR